MFNLRLNIIAKYCTEQMVSSDWINHEVNTALEVYDYYFNILSNA